jgi:hypothetical protein
MLSLFSRYARHCQQCETHLGLRVVGAIYFFARFYPNLIFIDGFFIGVPSINPYLANVENMVSS